MNFTLPPHIEDYRRRYRAFVAEHLLPLEADRGAYDEHENIRLDLLDAMRARARAAGLWAPQMPLERGGRGLPVAGMAACYEEMNYSIFGPATFNCAAPDDGNMIVLNKVGTEAQKARWLQPIIDGRVRSAIVMTEPAPGAGSDPAMMRTTATRKGDRWVIHGRKWFITGAGVAQHFILIAKTSDDPRKGLTAFLYDRDQPGWRIMRRIPIMGPEEHGGHHRAEAVPAAAHRTETADDHQDHARHHVGRQHVERCRVDFDLASALAHVVGGATFDDLAAVLRRRQAQREPRREARELLRYFDPMAYEQQRDLGLVRAEGDVLQQPDMNRLLQERMEIEQRVNARLGNGADVAQRFLRVRVVTLRLEVEIEALQAVRD